MGCWRAAPARLGDAAPILQALTRPGGWTVCSLATRPSSCTTAVAMLRSERVLTASESLPTETDTRITLMRLHGRRMCGQL